MATNYLEPFPLKGDYLYESQKYRRAKGMDKLAQLSNKKLVELLLSLEPRQAEQMISENRLADRVAGYTDTPPRETLWSMFEGYTAPVPLPDDQLVPEYYIARVERDYGMSTDPEKCSGYTPFEREFVASSMRTLVGAEPSKRYLATAHSDLYRCMLFGTIDRKALRYQDLQIEAATDGMVMLRKNQYVVNFTSFVKLFGVNRNYGVTRWAGIDYDLDSFARGQVGDAQTIFSSRVHCGVAAVLDDQGLALYRSGDRCYFSGAVASSGMVQVHEPWIDPYDNYLSYFSVIERHYDESRQRVLKQHVYQIQTTKQDEENRPLFSKVIVPVVLKYTEEFSNDTKLTNIPAVRYAGTTTIRADMNLIAITLGSGQTKKIQPRLPFTTLVRTNTLVVPTNKIDDQTKSMRLLSVFGGVSDAGKNYISVVNVRFATGLPEPVSATVHTISAPDVIGNNPAGYYSKVEVVDYQTLVISFWRLVDTQILAFLLDLNTGVFSVRHQKDYVADFDGADQNIRMRPHGKAFEHALIPLFADQAKKVWAAGAPETVSVEPREIME